MIKGYKCFNKDLTNAYGTKFDIGTTYSIQGDLEFGVNGNGFHFCKNFEDTLRFFDAMNEEVIICEVIGDGEILTYDDEYNGYYDMYVSEQIKIIRTLSRNEIITLALKMNFIRATRFIQSYKLTTIEKELFQLAFSKNITVLNAIKYYQNEDYRRSLKKK